MHWRIIRKIIRIILYTLLAVVFIGGLLAELWPNIYPAWVHESMGIVGLVIIACWLAWCVADLVITRKIRKPT